MSSGSGVITHRDNITIQHKDNDTEDFEEEEVVVPKRVRRTVTHVFDV